MAATEPLVARTMWRREEGGRWVGWCWDKVEKIEGHDCRDRVEKIERGMKEVARGGVVAGCRYTIAGKGWRKERERKRRNGGGWLCVVAGRRGSASGVIQTEVGANSLGLGEE